MGKSLYDNMKYLISVSEVGINVVFNNAINAGASSSVAVSGYSPKGVVGWNQSTGAHVFLNRATIDANNTLTVGARRANNDAISGTVGFNIRVLYIKNI